MDEACVSLNGLRWVEACQKTSHSMFSHEEKARVVNNGKCVGVDILGVYCHFRQQFVKRFRGMKFRFSLCTTRQSIGDDSLAFDFERWIGQLWVVLGNVLWIAFKNISEKDNIYERLRHLTGENDFHPSLLSEISPITCMNEELRTLWSGLVLWTNQRSRIWIFRRFRIYSFLQ